MESFQFHGTAFNGRVTGRLVQFHTLQLNPYKWKVLHYGKVNLTLSNETVTLIPLRKTARRIYEIKGMCANFQQKISINSVL